jgi:hypothetical protein
MGMSGATSARRGLGTNKPEAPFQLNQRLRRVYLIEIKTLMRGCHTEHALADMPQCEELLR